DDHVRGDIGEARGFRIGEPVFADECDIRTSDGVRIGGELEPRFRVDLTQAGGPNVRAQPEGKLQCYAGVPEPRQLAHYQHALDELDALVREVDVQQLVRGHEGGRRHAVSDPAACRGRPPRTRAAASPRRCTWSFSRMLWTWFLTVATSIRSRLAISLFERPSSMSPMISRSRLVRCAWTRSERPWVASAAMRRSSAPATRGERSEEHT